MLRLGPICILTNAQRERLVDNLRQADAEFERLDAKQAELKTQQSAVIEKQGELLREARRERDLAHARALEYQGLFVEQQAEIDSLHRQLSVAHHPSTQPRQDES